MCYISIFELSAICMCSIIRIVLIPTEESFMLIDIQASGFKLTDGLREHTERRLQLALGRADRDARKVIVRLSDISGPRGGYVKRCYIQIPVQGRPDVVIEDVETDLFVAIDRAADRIERTVARRLERPRTNGKCVPPLQGDTVKTISNRLERPLL